MCLRGGLLNNSRCRLFRPNASFSPLAWDASRASKLHRYERSLASERASRGGEHRGECRLETGADGQSQREPAEKHAARQRYLARPQSEEKPDYFLAKGSKVNF